MAVAGRLVWGSLLLIAPGTRTIVGAADRPGRREYGVGTSTVLTILGNRVAPGLLDRYLARTGYRSQQTARAADHDRPNLWHPLDGPGGHDYAARGSFSARSHSRSPQAWLSRRRLVALAGLAGATAGTLVWLRCWSPRSRPAEQRPARPRGLPETRR
ncbi:hypothetical protein AWW66_01670 [Micromonospora rosaria]|uniref:Uncharacterized protein n=1 Tax=Micromonospora rosaria TaxID=47874 RepID=A0A136PZN5_9ACTN|nr:hypothetical protein AWW66_01670 [Micromonospora rosaria]